MTFPVFSQPLFRHGAPTYTHDCAGCKFLGTVNRQDSRQIPENVSEVDLYAHFDHPNGCATDVVARYGNEPIKAIRGQGQHPFTREPHLEAAAERTMQLGFLGGA